MLLNPRIGQRVQVWYRESVRAAASADGRIGTVVVRSRGKPRNHGVQIGERMYVVPCGNLRSTEAT